MNAYKPFTAACSLMSPPLTISTPQPRTTVAILTENLVHLYHLS